MQGRVLGVKLERIRDSCGLAQYGDRACVCTFGMAGAAVVGAIVIIAPAAPPRQAVEQDTFHGCTGFPEQLDAAENRLARRFLFHWPSVQEALLRMQRARE